MEFDTTSKDYSLKAFQANRDSIKAKTSSFQLECFKVVKFNCYIIIDTHKYLSYSPSKADQRGSLGESGTMDFQTTANTSFTGSYGGQKSKSLLRPRSTLKIGSDDHTSLEVSSSRSNPETSIIEHQEMQSTSRSSYVGHATNRRTVAHRPPTSQKVGEGSFEGQTTARSSFTSHQGQVEKSRPIKHESHNILNTDSGVTGASTYSKTFESYKTHHCPVLDLQVGQSVFSFNEEKNGHMFYVPKSKA
ncbi:uncharacterized protein CEXT_670121 [Caerostris extrusa]|uniref:Uncharacterized protein n=1 Tax=Caerostris extrusa TaxID=172846 RepID=A0AAV4UJC8_CAEEX|nr:uncharacterized protein CEXT_670121 [Caerostris extrusa]